MKYICKRINAQIEVHQYQFISEDGKSSITIMSKEDEGYKLKDEIGILQFGTNEIARNQAPADPAGGKSPE